MTRYTETKNYRESRRTVRSRGISEIFWTLFRGSHNPLNVLYHLELLFQLFLLTLETPRQNAKIVYSTGFVKMWIQRWKGKRMHTIKIYGSCTLVTHVYPSFKQFACFYFTFSLASCDCFICFDCPLCFPHFWFYDTRSAGTLTTLNINEHNR